jgi:hypothetical protein
LAAGTFTDTRPECENLNSGLASWRTKLATAATGIVLAELCHEFLFRSRASYNAGIRRKERL